MNADDMIRLNLTVLLIVVVTMLMTLGTTILAVRVFN